jgi:hypothetical protein
MTFEQFSDVLIGPVLADKSPAKARAILLELRRDASLRARVWIDQQLSKLPPIDL